MKSEILSKKLSLNKQTVSNLFMASLLAGEPYTTLPETQYWGCSFAICPTTGEAAQCEDTVENTAPSPKF